MEQGIKSLQYHGYAGAHSISIPPQNPTARLYNQRGNRGITNLVTWPNSQSQMEAPSARLQNLCWAQNCLSRDLPLRSDLGGPSWLLRRGQFQLILLRTPRLLRGAKWFGNRSRSSPDSGQGRKGSRKPGRDTKTLDRSAGTRRTRGGMPRSGSRGDVGDSGMLG